MQRDCNSNNFQTARGRKFSSVQPQVTRKSAKKKDKQCVYVVPNLKLYLQYCEIRGLSEVTINLYKMVIEGAYNLLEAPSKPLTTRDIELLVQKLKTRNNKPTSISIYLRSLKTFFDWSIRQGHLTENPVGKLSSYFRMQTQIINSLSITAVQSILDSIRTNNRNVERDVV